MEAFKVICRFRQDFDNADYSNWTFSDEKSVYLQEKKDKNFTFDRIFPEFCDQEEVYEQAISENVFQFMNGYNCTIFAYGQSGSGKTFTMLGPEKVTESLILNCEEINEETQKYYGIIPRAILTIFNTINTRMELNEEENEENEVKKIVGFSIKISYLEIYNECVNDILTKPVKSNLKIREFPNIGMVVIGLEERIVTSPEEIFECLATGTHNKMVASTNQNQRSSRSHTVLIINMIQKDVSGKKIVSKFNLVDLAGSEKVDKTGATGQTLEEAKKINQSLSCLGLCILALSNNATSKSGKKQHVPYRDSKLTLILKESLGGNSKTVLMCNCSKKKVHEDETISTLKFAQRAKSIKNSVTRKVMRSPVELERLLEKIEKEKIQLIGFLQRNNIAIPKDLADLKNEKISLENNGDNELNIKFNEKLQIKLENLEENLKQNEEILEEKTLEIEELCQTIDNLAKEKQEIILKHEGIIGDLSDQNEYLTKEFEEINMQLNLEKQININLKKEINFLTIKSTELEEKLQKTNFEKIELEKKISNFENFSHFQEEEFLKILSSFENYEQKIKDLEEENEKINLTLKQEALEESSLLAELESLKKENEKLELESKRIKEEKEIIFNDHEKKFEKSQQLFKNIIQNEEQLEKVMQELELFKKTALEKISIEEVLQKMDNNNQIIKENHQNELNSLEIEINKAKYKLNEINRKHQLEKEELTKQYNYIQNNIVEDLKKKIQEQEEQIFILNKNLIELQIENNLIEKKTDKLKNNFEEKKIQNENLLQKIEIAKKELNSLEQKKEKIEQELEETKNSNSLHIEELVTKINLEYSNFENEICHLNEEKKKLLTILEEQENSIEIFKKNNKNENNVLEKKNDDYDNLVSEYKSLKKILKSDSSMKMKKFSNRNKSNKYILKPVKLSNRIFSEKVILSHKYSNTQGSHIFDEIKNN